jgi:hypothetical protein
VGQIGSSIIYAGLNNAYAIASLVNQRVAKDGHILMLFESRGYYFDRQVIQDSDATNWPLLAPKAAGGDCLRAAGITHVLLNSRVAGYYVHRGLDPQLLQLPSVREFIHRCSTPLYQGGGFGLYELRR